MALIIADDEPGIPFLIRRYLLEHEESRDSVVTTVESLDDMWKFFDDGGKTDLVFLDLVFRNSSAEETLAIIPRLMKYCPRVVVISGYEGYRAASLSAGASDFLNKTDDMRSSQPFFERIAKFFREQRPPTKAEQSLQRLREIVHPQESDG